MRTLTVIGRDNSNTANGYEAVLIYIVCVETLDHDEILAAYTEAREDDLEVTEDENNGPDCEILFAYEGDLNTVADWR